MVDEIRQKTDSVRTLYEDLFEFSPAPTAVFDMQGQCRLANRAFCTQLGYQLEEVAQTVSLPDIFVLPEEGRAYLAKILGQGIIQRTEVRLRSKYGDHFTALLSGRKLSHHGQEQLEISFINIAQQKELQRALRQEHMRLSFLIDNLTAGVFLADKNGGITEANAALGRLLDTEPEELISQPYQTLFAHLISIAKEPDVLQAQLSSAALRAVERPTIEFSTESAREPLKFLEITLFPVFDEKGRPLGWGGLVQDVSEMRQQTMWKLELLSMLSHDLRSPLANLKGHATALLASHTQWSPEMVSEFLEAINRGVDQLVYQVDRNLAVTRVETGRIGLRPESVDPAHLVLQALERVAGLLEDRQLLLDLGESLPRVRVDPGRVEEVLINLLENAVRYSAVDEPIQIRVRPNEHWIQIAIIDRGPGIPADRQQVIFDKYVRIDSSGSGAGLGLYISRKIIDGHGGRIWVQSPPPDADRGSAFIFTLPRLSEISEKPLPESDPRTEFLMKPDHQPYRVLVVEDETDYQALMRTVLTSAGFEVELAPDGASAIDILQTLPADLVLLDWRLKGTDGLQICRNIRRWSNVPIIMITAKSAPADMIAALDAGADDYITKPFQRDELLARIRALLRRGDGQPLADQSNRFQEGGLLVDFDSREVWSEGKKRELTATEQDLLQYMCRHPQQVLTYEQLINTLWPHGGGTRHALSVHVSRLRSKIEPDPKDPTFIVTRWGVGYVFLPRMDRSA